MSKSTVKHINRKTHALDIQLLNLADQKSLALLANDDGQTMVLEIANVSAGLVQTKKVTSGAHIAIHFRKGVIVDVSKITLSDSDKANWHITFDAGATDTDRVLLRCASELLLNPEEAWKISLNNVKANSKYGALNSSVTFRYTQMTDMDIDLDGEKRQPISLVNHIPPEITTPGLAAENKTLDALTASLGQIETGKNVAQILEELRTKLDKLEVHNKAEIAKLARISSEKLPLRVGFAGPNFILNDATNASDSKSTVSLLKIEVTNTSVKPVNFSSNSRISISYDASDNDQRDWAIAHKDHTAHFSFKPPKNWNPEGKDTTVGATFYPKDGTTLAAQHSVVFEISNIRTALPSGPARISVAFDNIPLDGADSETTYPATEVVLTVQKSPLVFKDKKVGIGVSNPSTALDTGKGLISGASNAYTKAQFALTGGGKVEWTGAHLKWSNRFLAISVERGRALQAGHINIYMPKDETTIPVSGYTHSRSNGKRTFRTSEGFELKAWEALYAVHTVGNDQSAIEFKIKSWEKGDFEAASNWILVAVRNDEDKTLKLGTGVILAAKSASLDESPIPSGVILMWHGDESSIPDGWALCDGKKNTPDLRGRFVVGVGEYKTEYNLPEQYTVGKTGGFDRVKLTETHLPAHTHGVNDPGHKHGYIDTYPRSDPENRSDRYDMDRKKIVQAYYNRETNSSYTGISIQSTGGGSLHENRPRYYALCYIMKL